MVRNNPGWLLKPINNSGTNLSILLTSFLATTAVFTTNVVIDVVIIHHVSHSFLNCYYACVMASMPQPPRKPIPDCQQTASKDDLGDQLELWYTCRPSAAGSSQNTIISMSILRLYRLDVLLAAQLTVAKHWIYGLPIHRPAIGQS